MSSLIRLQCPKELNFLRPRVIPNLSRMGNIADGGYAITASALLESSHFLSLGLGENWSFENVVRRINLTAPIDIYDHTVSLAFFTRKALKGIAKFLLLRDSFSGLKSRFMRLHHYFKFWKLSSLNRHHQVRIAQDVFQGILSKYPSDSRIGLKIDIEGSEWEILELVAKEINRFEFILLEVHNFEQHEADLRKFLSDIQDFFVLSHLHANNFEPLGGNGFPKVFEITLLKKSEVATSTRYREELPVEGLDAPNAKNRPDFHISFI